MAKTVGEGFRVFHSRLTPTGGQSDAAKKHRASIETCMKQNFEITRFFRSGSFGNATSVRGFSDVDYFASIPPKHIRQDSNTMLSVVRSALDTRFPNTGVAVRTPAVLVPFGKDRSNWTDVVPARYYKKTDSEDLIYRIADGDGSWAYASPSAHQSYVSSIDTKLNKRVKPVIRFLKAWKYYRNVPISSFFLELRVAKYASSQKSIVYSIDVRTVLKLLWDNQLASVTDPMGISGYVAPCSSDAKKTDALSKLETALARAQKARVAETAGRTKDAFSWWDLVFAGHFPAYV